MIIYTGFADEAGSTLQEQINATKELGWDCIDIRGLYGKNFTDITDEEFEEAYKLLKTETIRIPCFGSAIANSCRKPWVQSDVDYNYEALKRAVPRMKRLNTKFVRGMALAYNNELSLEENEKMVFPIMKDLVKMCADNAITFVCENCGGYAGNAYSHLIRLANYLDTPYFKVAYDSGNPIGGTNMDAEPPYPPQDSWDFYQAVRELIGYVHIKDQKIDENGKVVRTFPGEGEAQVERIVADLIRTGYDGYMSIEPHMHNGFDGYVEYGRRLMKIVDSVK